MSASVNPPANTEGFVELVSRTVVLRERNIDTDQIIPARFLTTTERKGLGRFAFNDWRYLADGSLNPAFELNKPHNAGAAILVAGRNFGCGSSREHAPWALTDLGLRAVISSEIADIFRSNSLKNGLLPIVVAQELLDELLEQPGIELRVDVRTRTLQLPDGRGVQFPLDAFAQTCLIEGVDQLGYLLRQIDAIHQFEQRRDAAVHSQQEQHHAR
jgi:3-isopropylmalate/(R)-2-methylmalate dehydratase small subunit